VARRALAALNRAAFRPDTSSPSLNSLLALTPGIFLGLYFFRLPALEMLLLALLAGGAVQVGARRLRLPTPARPLVAALVGVALVGPGASLVWAGVVALLASLLEVARARLATNLRLQLGVVCYALVLLVSRGALAAYLSPRTMLPGPEPIRLWLQAGSAASASVDPVRLYVGNVPGPVFATSLLGVALGAAWLWYARRLSLPVLLVFGLAAFACARLMGWSPLYQLVSGPLWFGAVFALADRRLLPSSGAAAALLGIAAGVVAMAARVRGFGIESAPIAVAGLQVVVALVEGTGWLLANRRRLGRSAAVPSRPLAGVIPPPRGQRILSRARPAPRQG
jgi:Na+-translocating ferredoxin:NAD+ oxidoreductase RnfD subunit